MMATAYFSVQLLCLEMPKPALDLGFGEACRRVSQLSVPFRKVGSRLCMRKKETNK